MTSTPITASYLFMVYLWEQLGDAGHSGDCPPPGQWAGSGLVGAARLPARAKPGATAGHWAAANYLDTPSPAGEYNYERLDLEPVQVTDRPACCPLNR